MRTLSFLLLVLVFLASAGTAGAQGMWIPDDERVRPDVVLTQHRVEAVVKDQRASTTVQQVFANRSARALEGTYLFPIPGAASVAGFAMWVDGKEMTGELVEAERARQIYTDIVRRMRDPGLLEYAGRDLFRARVFPVPPRGAVRIEVVYHQILAYDTGLIEYRYPISVTPSRMNGGECDFSIVARIEANQAIKTLYCPNYEVERRLRGKRGEVSYEGPASQLNGDFALYYSVSARDVAMSLVCNTEGRGDGHFMLLVSPGELERREHVIAKDVVFVFDRSGSMAGEQIKQAREALHYCIAELNPGDRFGIVTFATTIDAFDHELVAANDRNKSDARVFVDKLRATGGTNIGAALDVALRMVDGDRPGYVLFLTDGRPTVGATDIDRIVDGVTSRNEGGARLFVFGVGYEVNTRLLDGLSSENRGVVTYVEPSEDIEVKVSSLFAKVSEPVLTDLRLDFGGVTVADVYPEFLPDLFNGSQLVVTGRFKNQRATTIRLSGKVDGRTQSFEFDADFARGDRDFEFVPRVWATRKIGYLLEQIRRNGRVQELIDEIVDLATRYGIVTPYTSYLILEDVDGLSLHGSQWDVLRDEAARVPGAPAQEDRGKRLETYGFTDVSGESAVKTSRSVADAKAQNTVGPTARDVRHVGAKTFLFNGTAWVDGDYDENMDHEEIQFLSDAYFRLCSDHPAVAAYLALGEQVLFVHQGTAYRIVAN